MNPKLMAAYLETVRASDKAKPDEEWAVFSQIEYLSIDDRWLQDRDVAGADARKSETAKAAMGVS